jgi:hypothetical protein
MARRPDGSGRLDLSPRARLVVGWIAALLIIGAIALFVRLLGGNADGSAVLSSPSATAGAGAPATIRFGTALDPATGEVAAGAETDRFVETDAFAYSFRPADPPPTTVWVEVRRAADGSGEEVQPPLPHRLADDALVIAFQVEAAALFRDFLEPGPYQMRIYLVEGEPAAAVGSFELVRPAPSASP